MELGNYFYNEEIGYIEVIDINNDLITVRCKSNNKEYVLSKENLEKNFIKKGLVTKFILEYDLNNFDRENSKLVDDYFNNMNPAATTSNSVTEEIEVEVIYEKDDKNSANKSEKIKSTINGYVEEVKDTLKETGKFIKDIFNKL